MRKNLRITQIVPTPRQGEEVYTVSLATSLNKKEMQKLLRLINLWDVGVTFKKPVISIEDDGIIEEVK